MSKPFLGVGWSFPIRVNSKGKMELAHYEESVRQSIWTILGTAKGERVMRPDFGCGIHDMVFEVVSPTTIGKVSQAVRQSLLLFEPRIQVIDVQVSARSGGKIMLISIDYRVQITNNVFNLVYPFYLERSGA